jgi:RNA polymerase sigma-70 factor (family 1)
MKNPGHQIIADFKEGSKEAFAAVYKSHYAALFFFVKRFVTDRAEAEDITAETFIKLWKIRHNFNSHQNIKAFLYITARNACLDCLRARQRSTGMQQEMLYLLLQQNDITFIHDEIKADVLMQVKERIEDLPPKCKQIFKMAFFERLKNAEIAAKLGLTLQTVKNQKVRAIKLLRLALNKDLVLMTILFFFHNIFVE